MNENNKKIQVTTWDVFKNIWKYGRNYKLMVFLILLGIAVSSVLGISEFYVYKLFIDKVTVFVSKNINYADFFPEILYILLFYLTVKLFDSWIFSASLFVMIRFEYNMQAKFSEVIFAHLHKLSMRFHSNKKTGSVLKKMNRGINALEIIIENLFFNVLPIIAKVVFFALLLIYFDWRISIITIAIIVVFMIWSIILTDYQQKFIDNENKAEDDAQGIATDSLINYETVKYFTNENYENTRYIEKLNDWVKKGKKAWKYGPLIFGGQETIFILGSIFILYLAVLNVINNIFTVGDIVLVGAYLSNMTGLMNGLSYAYRNIKKSITDKKEIIKILKEDSEIKEIENPKVLGKVKGEILYKNVSFAYHNQNIIKDFNLKIKAGEKVAFVGSSGGGKSTLIVQLLPRFYDIQKGQILIDGIDIKTITLKSLRQNIAIVSQESILFNDTIYNNILYGRTNATKSDVDRASKQANLDKFIKTLKNGYDTLVGERGIKLSGGQKQRIGIARAILANSPILILDEATSSLDSKTESLVQESIHTLIQNKTTLIIAHRLSTVSRSDKIIVLDKGRISDIGNHKELLKKSAIYKELWDIQAGSFID